MTFTLLPQPRHRVAMAQLLPASVQEQGADADSLLQLAKAMSPEEVLAVGRHALEVTLLLAAPLLLTALVVGLLVGIFQAASLHATASLPNVPYHEYQHSIFDKNLRYVTTAMRCEGGFFHLPEGPGLDVEPKPELWNHLVKR